MHSLYVYYAITCNVLNRAPLCKCKIYLTFNHSCNVNFTVLHDFFFSTRSTTNCVIMIFPLFKLTLIKSSKKSVILLKAEFCYGSRPF